MSPQFVDFNGDGKFDIVAGTFDGSPHVAYGGEKGLDPPAQILERSGERIVLNQFWNYDKKKWDETRRSDLDCAEHGHLTSAVAFDWDGDGDFDLLLGDHKTGHVYRRINEGTNPKPAFASKNIPVNAGGKPIEVPGTVATLRLVDWNGDGLDDLIVSTMGDAYNPGRGAGVYVLINAGTKREPAFDAPRTLIGPGTAQDVDHPVRPDAGLYADVSDIDGDGDLDLVVGGYSFWTRPAPELTPEQQKRLAELKNDLAATQESSKKLNEAHEKAVQGLDEEAAEKRSQKFYEEHKSDFVALGTRQVEIKKELDPLEAGPKRDAFVWLYENVTPKLSGQRDRR